MVVAPRGMIAVVVAVVVKVSSALVVVASVALLPEHCTFLGHIWFFETEKGILGGIWPNLGPFRYVR